MAMYDLHFYIRGISKVVATVLDPYMIKHITWTNTITIPGTFLTFVLAFLRIMSDCIIIIQTGTNDFTKKNEKKNYSGERRGLLQLAV